MNRKLDARLAKLEERIAPAEPLLVLIRREGETHDAARQRGLSDPKRDPRTVVVVLDPEDEEVL